MPAPKTTSSASPKPSRARKSSSAAGTTAKRSASSSKSTPAVARSGAKATATSARNAAAKTATQVRSGATKTARAAQAGSQKTARSASQGGARSTARAAGDAAADTAKTARTGAKGTATAARGGAKRTATTAKSATTKTRRTSNRVDGVAAAAEQLASRAVKPKELVMLTRDRIQETLDEAAARGRVTRRDANELVAELIRRSRSQTDELVGDLEQLLDRGREQLESATKRARKTEPVDRLVQRADRARRAAGVGPTFPILGYDDLNVPQVQERLKDLRKPELRKVRNYESKHANRKSVLAAIDKSLA